MGRKSGSGPVRRPEIAGRLQQLVDAGDTRELARRAMTLQSVMLDLHRQLAAVESQSDLARTLGLALTGSFACERLVVLRRDRTTKHFESVSEIGDVPAALHEEAPGLAARVAPFLPHVPLLAPLLPPFSEGVAEPVQRLTALGFVRAVWLNVEKQVDWLVLVGPKLSGEEYDTFDVSLLRATLDATTLACSRLLLVDALEDRNRQLVAANQRLHQIDDLKTAILAGVNHEMRTPLQRILMYAEALRDESPRQEETRQFLDIILDNTKRLGARIGEALSFAELIGDRRAPQSQHVSLPEVAQAAVERHLESASAQSIDLQMRSEPLAVMSDPQYVRMILDCLVDNAVKFTPPGGEVVVEVVPDGSGAMVRVSDTGPGIPEEARDRIWRLFEHGDLSTSREPAGLGLGLALAQRLSAELGVRLELLQSSPAGSVFGLFFGDAAPAAKRREGTTRRLVGSLQR